MTKGNYVKHYCIIRYLNNTRRVGTVCKDLGAVQTLADLPPPGWKAWIPLPAAATPRGSSSRALTPRRDVARRVRPAEVTFAPVLQACGSGREMRAPALSGTTWTVFLHVRVVTQASHLLCGADEGSQLPSCRGEGEEESLSRRPGVHSSWKGTVRTGLSSPTGQRDDFQ